MTESVHGRSGDTERALDVHYRFILWLIPTLERFPRSQKFLLGDRIHNCAMNIFEALIESTYTKRRNEPLSRANLGIGKLRFFIRLCRDLKYLDPRRHEYAVRALEKTGRRIGAWEKRIIENDMAEHDLFDGTASFSALLRASNLPPKANAANAMWQRFLPIRNMRSLGLSVSSNRQL